MIIPRHSPKPVAAPIPTVGDPELVNLQHADPAGTTDGLPTPRRYWAAAAIWLALAMAVIDSAIANVALPTIAQDLGASAPSAIWVVNAYQIAITMALLPAAALGEIVGYRRVYMAGLTLFVVASLGCALADSLPVLAAARFGQGFGAACVMAINGALVRFTYPRAMLGRGVGYNALVVAIVSAIGPTVAAAILAVAPWPWLFAINVPFGLLSLAIGWRCLPDSPRATTTLDVRAAVLNAATFGLLFLAASDLARGTEGWTTSIEAAAGFGAGAVLIRRARGQKRPLVPLDLLRVPLLRLSYATSACSFGAQMIALVSLPFYFQRRFGYDHVETGLLLTPMPLGIAVAAPIAGRLVERVSAGLLGGIGLLVLAAGLAAMALGPADAGAAWIVAAMAVSGFGFGFFQSPNNRTMLGAAPPDRSGAAAGMLATARLVGQTLGAVAVAFLFRVAGTASAAPLAVAAVLAVVAALFSLGRLRAPEIVPAG